MPGKISWRAIAPMQSRRTFRPTTHRFSTWPLALRLSDKARLSRSAVIMAAMGGKQTLELGHFLISKRIPDASPEPVAHIRNDMALVQFTGVANGLHLGRQPLATKGSFEQAKCILFRTGGDADTRSVSAFNPVGNQHWHTIGRERATANDRNGSKAVI